MDSRGLRIAITDTESDSIDIELREAKKSGADVERAGSNCRTEHEVISVAKDADALLVDIAPITRNVIESLRNCRVIVRCDIGLDKMDLQAATDAGACVVNSPMYCVDEVSTHAVALA